MAIKCYLCRRFLNERVEHRAALRRKRSPHRGKGVTRKRRAPIKISGWAICRACRYDDAKPRSIAVSIAEVLGRDTALTALEITRGLIKRGWPAQLEVQYVETAVLRSFTTRFLPDNHDPSRWSLTAKEMEAYQQRRNPAIDDRLPHKDVSLTGESSALPPLNPLTSLAPDMCFFQNNRYSVVVERLPDTDQVWMYIEGVEQPNVRLHEPSVLKYLAPLPESHPATIRLRAAAALARTHPPPPDSQANRPTHLPWELLPPGERGIEQLQAHLIALSRNHPDRRWDHSRLAFMASLHPERCFYGVAEYRQYFAFEFSDPHVAVLDCPVYGNAIYILEGDGWKALSKLAKLDLLRTGQAHRIIHTQDERWRSRVRTALRRTL